MNFVSVLDKSTQESFPIKKFDDSEEALLYKEKMQVKYPENIFVLTINSRLIPDKFYKLNHVLK